MSFLAASCIAVRCRATDRMGSSSEAPNVSLKISSEILQSTRFLFTSAATVATLVMGFQHSSLGNDISVSSEEDVRWRVVNCIPKPARWCSATQLLLGHTCETLFPNRAKNICAADDRGNRDSLVLRSVQPPHRVSGLRKRLRPLVYFHPTRSEISSPDF